MKKIALVILAGASVAILGLTAAPNNADAAKACVRTTFKTKLVEAACKKGGQDAAKKDMKTFLKTAKKKNADLNCQSCHTKLAPDYPLKPDGMKLYKEYGGQ